MNETHARNWFFNRRLKGMEPIKTTILCKTRWDTCSTITIKNFIIKMYVYKMTCVIQYPCSSHASSPPSPHMYTHVPYSFAVHFPRQHWFWGAWNIGFITKCPNSFVQDCSKPWHELKSTSNEEKKRNSK